MYRKIKKKTNKKNKVINFFVKLKNIVYICGVRKSSLPPNYGIINAGIM
jgi:hypothetical protein